MIYKFINCLLPRSSSVISGLIGHHYTTIQWSNELFHHILYGRPIQQGRHTKQRLLLPVDHLRLHQHLLHVHLGHQDGLGTHGKEDD